MIRFLRAATLVFFAAHGAVALAGGPPLTCPTIGMSPTSLPNGDLATAYTSTVTSSGGTAPVAIDVTHGVLPNGVNLTDNGNGTATFSGTSTQTGAFEFTITATDFNGCSGGRTYATTFAAASQTITYTSTAPVGATVGGPTYNVTATATSGLPVALTIDATASAVCSIAGSTVSFIGVGTCVIDANQAGNATFGPAPQVQQSFAVGQGAQTITFTSTAPAAATVGGATYNVTATATSGLPVALTIDATASAVCSIAGSTVSFTAIGTCVIDANQAGNANYTAAPQVQQNFAVGQGAQTITFTSTAPAAASVGGPTYNVTATATSGLAVAFTIDATATSVCSIAGSTVSFIAAGTCVIDANQAGNANYTAAPQVQQSFGVGKANQTITYTSTAPVGASVGGPTYNVTATATSGLTVAFTIDASASTVCTIAGSTVSFIGAGTCVIDANQAGDANFNPAPQVQQSFVVGKGNQTITFTSIAPVGATVGGATYNVTATATSGLPVALTIDASASTVCTIAGSTVSFIGAGTCVIDANQAGNANYNPAPQVQQSFLVGPGSQTITFTSTAPAAATFGGPTYNVTATATSGLPVTLTIDATASTVCSIAGSTVSFIGVGTCVIDANQAGNANYNAAPQVQQSFAVAKSNQTISFTSTAPAAAVVAGPTYNVTATATSGLVVTLTIDATASTVCTLAGSTVSFIGAGTCVIDANQAGNANYNAAPQVQQSFVVSKQNQTISFTSTAPATAQNGGATYTVTATATSGLVVALTIDATASTVCSIAGATVTFIGAGTCVIDANQAGNATYNPAPQVQQSFLVAKGDQTITITSVPPALGATVAPNHTYNVTGTATSGLAVVFTIDATSAAVCSIAGATVTFNAAGVCTIDANQPGNVNWNPAPQVQQSITVLVPAGAVADSHAVTGNVGIASTSSVLTNDTGTSIVIKSYGATTGGEQIVIGNATPTAQGGSVTVVAGGTYTYTPPSNFTGADTFKYIIDNGLVRPSTGTVTLNVTDRIIIVSVAGGGSCSPVTPSPCTLAVADAAPIASGKDLVFVQSGTYPGAVMSLFAAQNLVGQQVSLAQAIADIGGITFAVDSVAIATIAANTRPVLNNGGTVVTLGGNNLVEYFNINPTGGSAVTGNAITTGANVHDITIVGTGAANGVNLTGNSTGSTFNFTNLVITTAGGSAFSDVGPGPAATTGGTVNITTGSIPNTLASTTGTALNITNTTIGAGGLNFQSISANGGSNGIVLNNTGAIAGLTVNGDGANTSVGGNSTGGTIANMSGVNGAISGSGIYLNNTRNVVLRRMTLNGTNQNFGIRGFLVNSFTLEYSTVSGVNGGNFNALPDDSGEGSIYFGNTVTNGISTQATFTNNSISGGAWDNMHVENTTAGTTTVTVKGNTFGLNGTINGNQSMIIEARNAGTTINSVVGGPAAGEANTFLGAPGGLANFTGQTGTTMDVQFKNNVMSNAHPNNNVGGGDLTLASQGVMTFVVDSNSMRGADGSTITLQKASLGTSFTGRVTNNTLGVTGVAASASKSGNGMFLSAAGTGTIGLTITGNQIRNWAGNAAMFFDNTGGSYTANFTIQNNIMAEAGAGSFSTLALTNGGNLTADTVNVCAVIGGAAAGVKNTFTGTAALAAVYLGSSGQNGGHTFNLPGYAGASNLANVTTFVTGNNTFAGGANVQAYDDNGGQGSFTGVGAGCATP